MKHLSAAILLSLTVPFMAHAQSYCAPSFANSCTLWHSQTIGIGSINWSIGSTACTVSDYTSLSTIVDAGVATPMTVTSGVWCGCAVWVDLDNNSAFEDTENLYYGYVGGDPGYTYSFSITLPPGTTPGPHRMRVIAPWGSDGFLNTNVNGYGPCGAFQYGNFDDFTLVVTDPLSAPATLATTDGELAANPNPTNGTLTVNAGSIAPERITIVAANGGKAQEFAFTFSAGTAQLDLHALPNGVYFLTCMYSDHVRTIRIVKD